MGYYKRPHKIDEADGKLKFRCTKCSQFKPRDQFPPLKNPDSKFGIGSWCRACVAVYDSARKKNWRQRKRELAEQRIAEHQAKMRESHSTAAA